MFHAQTLHGAAIYADIGMVWGVNVGIYSIHGVYGIENMPKTPGSSFREQGMAKYAPPSMFAVSLLERGNCLLD